jgi:hypothetical protein
LGLAVPGRKREPAAGNGVNGEPRAGRGVRAGTMEKTRVGLWAVIIAGASWAAGKDAPTTVAATVDREITGVERQVIEAAEAMPEDKFNFTPESLKVSGANFKGVRTFAVQVKHIASSNYFIWSPITGDKVPEEIKDGEGPEAIKTKADIIAFLRRSFALGHKAAGTLTPDNMIKPVGDGKWSPLPRALFGVEHAFEHYGQMVEYLRMNGIVPPETRKKAN